MSKQPQALHLDQEQRDELRRLISDVYETGRALKPRYCSPDVQEHGLRGFHGLLDVLSRPVKVRESYEREESACRLAVKRLHLLATATRISIEEEAMNAGIEYPPLEYAALTDGPTSRTGAVVQLKPDRARAAARTAATNVEAAHLLWKDATAAFQAADNLDDPAAPFARGLRLLCEGLAKGYVLDGPDRYLLGLALFSGKQAVETVFVPDRLPKWLFDGATVRIERLLDLLRFPPAVREQWPALAVAGLCADGRMLANAFEDAILSRIIDLGVEAFREFGAAQNS
ncbi:hypothetical protein B2G69_17020 [Methylorubrum zatmanii]|nr:hypothetical protein B2G69_17020 [Methylorubrum zatmanii]